jgi:hypothetical protein
LVVFGIDGSLGLGFALVFHVMEIIVMDVLGAIALWREAGSWAAMKAQLRSVTTSTADTPSI